MAALVNRRHFLHRLVPIAASIAVPELARTIFLAPRGGWPSRLPAYLTDPNSWYLKPGEKALAQVMFYERAFIKNAVGRTGQQLFAWSSRTTM